MTDAEIAALDAADPLAALREEFEIPEGLLYLDGNSLGPLTRAARLRMVEVVEQQWGHSLIRGWNDHDWMGAPRRVGDAIAGLIGAEPGEVIVADSTSANLFKLAVAAMQARPDRKVVLSEPGDFPTDLYMLEGTIRTLGEGRRLELRPADEIEAALTEEVALLVLCHAHYKTARIRDMARLTAAAHAVGALVIWDLSHSAGVLEVDLNGCNADLAVGCGYKYLNGGPGAPAFLFVARRHQDNLVSPLSGWMGHSAPFTFQDAYDPSCGIERFACGTPPVLGVSALECGVALSVRAGPKALRAKAAALTDLFISRVEAGPAASELRLVTPRKASQRGGHVSFSHPDGYAIVQALIARNVIGDFRDPDIARFGFSPLTLSFAQVARAADILGEVVSGSLYDRPEYRKRAAVT
jgi:kynureninase